MAEYIKEDDLLRALGDWWHSETPNAQDGKKARQQSRIVCAAIKIAIDLVRKMPISDVVECVRCKDCKHYDSVVSECMQWEENRNTIGGRCWVDVEDFCSRGERKTET